jgi:hypothetical protein
MAGWIARLGAGWTGDEALAIALICALSYPYSFRHGVLAAVNHSGDSDSTGSIAGNILGLINGVESMPPAWLQNLMYAGIVRQMAEDLYPVSTAIRITRYPTPDTRNLKPQTGNRQNKFKYIYRENLSINEEFSFCRDSRPCFILRLMLGSAGWWNKGGTGSG